MENLIVYKTAMNNIVLAIGREKLSSYINIENINNKFGIEEAVLVTGTTPDTLKKIRKDSKIYKIVKEYLNKKYPELGETSNTSNTSTNEVLLPICIDKINGFDVIIEENNSDLKLSIDGKLISIGNKESLEKIKEQLNTIQKIKLDIQTSSVGFNSLGERVLLYGPTGTGKTYSFLSSVNKLINEGKIDDFEIFSVGEGFEDIDFFQIIKIKNGKVSQKERRLVQKLRDCSNGKRLAFCIDEINRGSKSFNNLILKMLDSVNGKFYSLYNASEDEYINIPIENILWFATANIGGKYVGANIIDEALFDRFSIVYNHTYDKDVEKEIINNFGSNYKKQAKDIIKYIRDLYIGGDIRAPISTRGIKNWAEKFMNSPKDNKAFNDTFELSTLYRLCSIDDYGNINEQEKVLILSKFNSLGLL